MNFSYNHSHNYRFPTGFTKLQSTKVLFDSIGNRHINGLFDVMIDDKYKLFQVIKPKGDYHQEWINFTYKSAYNNKILPIYNNEYFDIMGHTGDYRYVKKSGKWGMIKLNPETKTITYKIPCECENKIRSYGNEVFICNKAVGKIIIYDNVKGKRVDIQSFKKKNYDYTMFSYDTIPTKDSSNKLQKNYLALFYGKYNAKYEDKKITEIHAIKVLDIKNYKIKAVYKDSNAAYTYYESPLGVLILKMTRVGKENQYDYYDLETGKKVFSFSLDSNYTVLIDYSHLGNRDNEYYLDRRKNIDRNGAYGFYGKPCKLQIYLYLRYYYYEKYERKYKTIGYYDFLTKKFYKKKPEYDKGC